MYITICLILSVQCPSFKPLFPFLEEGRMSGRMIESKGHWWQTIPGQRSRKRRNVILGRKILYFQVFSDKQGFQTGWRHAWMNWSSGYVSFSGSKVRDTSSQVCCCLLGKTPTGLYARQWSKTFFCKVSLQTQHKNEQYVSRCECREGQYHNFGPI